jgi:hypothetical protein
MDEQPQLFDMMAIFAMAALASREDYIDAPDDCIATDAFTLAYAMMQERQKYVLPSCNQRVNKPKVKKTSTSE